MADHAEGMALPPFEAECVLVPAGAVDHVEEGLAV